MGVVTTTNGASLDRWERRTGWPLTVAALAFLVAYAWPILQPDMPASRAHAFGVFGVIVWALFVIDYLTRVVLAHDRLHFVRRHVFDVVVIALPMLRPLRALRVLTVLGFLNRQSSSAFRGRVITYVIGATTLVVFIASLAQLDAERHGSNANIKTYGDALWWATSTITTVGYGERYPTTPGGRLVGFGLMLAGIALLGVITASFATWFLERVQQLTSAETKTKVTLEHVLDELHELRDEVRRLSDSDSTKVSSEAHNPL